MRARALDPSPVGRGKDPQHLRSSRRRPGPGPVQRSARLASWSGLGAHVYVLGPNPDERLIWVDTAGVVRYPHTDRRGSTIAVSQAGKAVERFHYGEFGQSGPTITGYPYRYTGQRLDAWTGLYNDKAREYAPSIGRFLQPDPLGFVDGPNVYAYVGNSPLNLVDPTGKCAAVIECAGPAAAMCAGPQVAGCVLVGGAVVVVAGGVAACVAWCDEVGRFLGNILNNDRGDALGEDGRLRQDHTGKVHGNLPEADEVPDEGVEDSIGALEGSLGVREEEQARFPAGDRNGNQAERERASPSPRGSCRAH